MCVKSKYDSYEQWSYIFITDTERPVFASFRFIFLQLSFLRLFRLILYFYHFLYFFLGEKKTNKNMKE